MWVWNDYASDSDTEAVSLFVSVRTQQLALAAIRNMELRQAWDEPIDATWDDIEESLSEANQELINEVAVSVDNTSFTVERTTTSFSLASGAWQPIPVDDGKNPDGAADFSSPYIKIVEGGLWRATLFASVRNASGGVSQKLVSLRNRTQNNRPCIGVSSQWVASEIKRGWYALDDIFECDDGDEFEFEIYSNLYAATIETDGTIGTLASRCLQGTFLKLR